jgi:hypothetical protein
VSEEQYRIGGDVRRMVERHDQDLYRGNGKPGLTERMRMAEKEIEDMVDRELRSVKKRDRVELLVWGALIVAIANLISTHFK